MSDETERKRVAKNWKEYIEDMKDSVKVYKWIWKKIINEKCRYWIKRTFIALGAATALSIAQPFLMSFIFNGIIQKKLLLIYLGLGLFFVFLLAQKLCHYYERAALEWLFGETVGSAEKEVCKRFFEKSINQHLQENSFLSAATVEKGKNRMVDLIHMTVSEGIETILGLLLSYLFIWFISPVAGIIMTCLMLIYLAFTLYINQKIVEITFPIEKEWRKFNNYRVERLDKIERVKTFGKESEETDYISSWFNKVIEKDRNFWLWVIKTNIIRGFINIAALTITIGYSAYMIYNGYWSNYSLGLLFPLYSWTSRITDNIWKIGQIEHNINWRLPSVYSLMEALSMKADVVDCDGALDLDERDNIKVEFSSVSHSYTLSEQELKNGYKNPQQILQNINFTIKPGEKVALIGSSGAGKTTIMRLLQRYMDPECGQILVNDISLADIKLKSWRKTLGYVPQQPQVFDGTIRDNITYGLSKEEREKISDEKIWNVMDALKINFGERLTDGLDTKVGKHGLKLSGGQAQRLMLGAAIIKKPRLLIIDEATSSLDSTTEKAVQEGFKKFLSPEVGALIITHRLNTVRRVCDKFIVLKSSDEPQTLI